MEDSLGRILKSVEKIAFTVIGLIVAFYLINTAISVSPSGYGRTLLEGLSVFYVIGGTILLLWVVYNAINFGNVSGMQRRGTNLEERKK